MVEVQSDLAQGLFRVRGDVSLERVLEAAEREGYRATREPLSTPFHADDF